jgi:hypothetical protein
MSGAPQERTMVTDMQRVERAARLSMGDFEAAPPSVPPPRLPFFASKAPAALAVLAVLTVAAILLA